MKHLLRLVVPLFLLQSAVGAEPASPATKTMPNVGQTLAVSVPENHGITLRLYRIESNGMLRPLPRTRLAETEGATNLQSLSFSSDGRSAYACFFFSGADKQEVRPYRIMSDGSLAPLAAPPALVGDGAEGLTLTPDGRAAYVTGRTGVWQFRRSAMGELTPLPVPNFAVGGPVPQHHLRREITKPGDKYSTYEVESNDAISPLQIVLDASGHYAYILSHQYYYKGTERVTSFEVQGGGTDVDVSRFVIRYRVQINGALVSPTRPMPVPISVSSLALTRQNHVLYAIDSQAKMITPCRLAENGVITPVKTPAVPGEGVCFHPSGHYAYIAANGSVAQYRVRGDGGLVPLVPASIPVPTAGMINGPAVPVGELRIDSEGRTLLVRYSTNESLTVVAIYRIHADGTLAANPASIVPVSGPYGFGEMTILPNLPQSSQTGPHLPTLPPTPVKQHQVAANEFAYVLNSADGTVAQYHVSDSGTLQPLSPPTIAAGRFLGLGLPGSMAVDSRGRFLYVPNGLGNSVSQFRITSDGTLTPLTPPTVKLAYQVVTAEVVVDASGHFAYVSDQNGTTVHTFSISPDGALVAAPALDLEVTRSLMALYVNPAAQMLLVLHDNDYLDSYRSEADGRLRYLGRFQPNLGQPFAFDPSGRFAFYGDGYGEVWQFRFTPNGSLMENVPRAVPADEQPEAVAVTPNGQFAYASNIGDFEGDGSLSLYRVDNGGRLKALNPPTLLTGTSPALVTVDPSGSFLYALSPNDSFFGSARSPHTGVISQYEINADGTLRSLSPVSIPIGHGASAIVVVRRS